MVSPVLGYSAVWRQDLIRKSSLISELFFQYLFSTRHHPLPPESDVPGGVVEDPHQLLLFDALQPVRVTFNALRLLFLLLFVFNVVASRTLTGQWAFRERFWNLNSNSPSMNTSAITAEWSESDFCWPLNKKLRRPVVKHRSWWKNRDLLKFLHRLLAWPSYILFPTLDEDEVKGVRPKCAWINAVFLIAIGGRSDLILVKHVIGIFESRRSDKLIHLGGASVVEVASKNCQVGSLRGVLNEVQQLIHLTLSYHLVHIQTIPKSMMIYCDCESERKDDLSVLSPIRWVTIRSTVRPCSKTRTLWCEHSSHKKYYSLIPFQLISTF